MIFSTSQLHGIVEKGKSDQVLGFSERVFLSRELGDNVLYKALKKEADAKKF